MPSRGSTTPAPRSSSTRATARSSRSSACPPTIPTAFAAGWGGQWTALNTDRLRPLQNRAIQGRYSPRVHVQDRGGRGRARGERDHAGLQSVLSRRRELLRAVFQVPLEGRPRKRRPAPRDREVLQRLLLYGRQHGRHRPAPQVGCRPGLADRSGIDLPHKIEPIMPSTQWKRARTGEKWYAGETISVSIGQGQVSVTPISLGLVMMASVANGGTPGRAPTWRAPWTTARAGSSCRRPRGRRIRAWRPRTCGRGPRGCRWMVVNGAGTGGRGQDRRLRRRGQDGDGAGHLEPGQGARTRGPRPARPRLVRVLSRRRRTRRLPASCSPSTPSTVTRRHRLPSS